MIKLILKDGSTITTTEKQADLLKAKFDLKNTSIYDALRFLTSLTKSK